MRIRSTLLLFGFWLSLILASVFSSAAIRKSQSARASIGTADIYQLVEKYRLKASSGATESQRRQNLKPFRAQLIKEIRNKRANSAEASYQLKRVLTQVNAIVKYDCHQSKEMIKEGMSSGNPWSDSAKQKDREAREGLYLHQSVCRS